MPVTGVVPDWLLTLVAAATVFTIMFDLGLAIAPGELSARNLERALLLKAIFVVVVAVPALAWLVARILDLPRPAEVGIMLMAISPGAPVALRQSLQSGGHRVFAPALQITVVALAVVSMPLSIAALDEYYGGTATVDPQLLARQVFTAQLLPLGLGLLARRFLAGPAARIESAVRRLAGALLLVFLVLALVDIWQDVARAGLRVIVAVALITVLAIAVGHLVGGPDPATRTATAISSAARNPGLALLVATLNSAPPAIIRVVLAYLVVAAVTMVPYVIWRRRVAQTTRSV